MRSSTNFIFGKEQGFGDILRNYYPAGKIIIIASDKEKGDKLARDLKTFYTCSVYSPEETVKDRAHFVIGFGGCEVISAVKRIAVNAKYAFIPSSFDYRFLFPFDNIFTLPEFVFLNEKVFVRDKKFFLQLYVSVYQLYAEIVFCAFYRSAFPYKNYVLSSLIKSGEDLLRGKTFEDEFVSRGIRFVEDATNELFTRKTSALLTEKMATAYGTTEGERFYIVTFLLLMLVNFTTRRFRDILLPSEKTWRTYENVGAETFDPECLPKRDLLTIVKRKVCFLSELPKPELHCLIKALRTNGDYNPIFSIINEKGITDALFYGYEKNEHGDRAVGNIIDKKNKRVPV